MLPLLLTIIVHPAAKVLYEAIAVQLTPLKTIQAQLQTLLTVIEVHVIASHPNLFLTIQMLLRLTPRCQLSSTGCGIACHL